LLANDSQNLSKSQAETGDQINIFLIIRLSQCPPASSEN